MTRANILDLSEAQGKDVDFQKIADGGYDGVILKASEGAHYTDPDFNDNCRRAKAANLLVGAYWFLTIHAPVEDQAALFIGTAVGRADFFAVDFESPAPKDWVLNVTGSDLVDRALKACNLVRQATTPTTLIVLYSYPDFIAHLPSTPNLALLAEYPLWIACYPDEKHRPADDAQPTGLGPWKTWLFWQWSGNNGLPAPGVPVVVDHNVFNGTSAELQALVIHPLEEIPPTLPAT